MLGWSVKRLQPGWIAIAPTGSDAHAVHVVWPEGERPALRWAASTDWADAASGLRQLRRSLPLQQHRCVAVLQRHQYQLLPMDAPDVPRPDWRDAVRWRLKDMVDFPVEDAGIDLLEIPAEHSQRGRTGLLAAVAPRRELEALVQAGDSARTRSRPRSSSPCAICRSIIARRACSAGRRAGSGWSSISSKPRKASVGSSA